MTAFPEKMANKKDRSFEEEFPLEGRNAIQGIWWLVPFAYKSIKKSYAPTSKLKTAKRIKGCMLINKV